MHKFPLILILLFLFQPLYSQSYKLADQYMKEGEYEKASVIFEKLVKKHPNVVIYYEKYITSLLELERYAEAESILQERIKEESTPVYSILLGELYLKQNEPDAADRTFREMIANLPAQRNDIYRAGNKLVQLEKYELAAGLFEKGGEITGKPEDFAVQLANIYRQSGDTDKMLDQYLLLSIRNPAMWDNLQKRLSSHLSSEDIPAFEEKIYDLIQEYPSADVLTEMLIWAALSRGDINEALRQAKALDRRQGSLGQKVYELAAVARDLKKEDAAMKAYDYIIEELGPSSPHYLNSITEKLLVKRKMILDGNPTSEELRELEQEYYKLQERLGVMPQTLNLLADLAELQALHLKEPQKAVQTYQHILNVPTANRYFLAQIKLDLGDLYLTLGDRWEATLLYSQVDKDFPEALPGEEARFRNAQLNYFVGDFELAQEQFNILKTSTSKLIANDALDLSVFITDNLGLDTTDAVMKLYAKADLQLFRNNHGQALGILDSLLAIYSGHGLEDDVYYLRGRIFEDLRQYDQALAEYSKVAERFSEDIRADNSLYHMALIYENHKNDIDRAMELYEKLFLNYDSSTLSVDARKRYRNLRGDIQGGSLPAIEENKEL